MKRALAVAGLMFGDEGKGATVDYFTRKYDAGLIVRYNGGPQTAHNVVTPEGVHHTFSQFGSGMLANSSVKTFLSRFMLVNPLSMDREDQALRIHGIAAYDRTYVDGMALIVTPYHKAMNRIREYERGISSRKIHGSCGMGIGECREYHLKFGTAAIFAGDLTNEAIFVPKLQAMKSYFSGLAKLMLPMHKIPEDLDDLYCLLTQTSMPFVENYLEWGRRTNIVGSERLQLLTAGSEKEVVIFEGAQGVLLDEAHGTFPHNTWTDTTFNNADTLLREMRFDGEVTKIGCVRTYATRHGAGPFPTEEPLWGHSESHNFDYGCSGRFRVGHFDAAAVRYALASCGDLPPVDYLAVSHFDALNELDVFKMCTEYNMQGQPVYKEFPRPVTLKSQWWTVVREAIEKYTYTPVGLTAWGPTAKDRIEHAGKGNGYKRRAIYSLPWVPRGAERAVGDGESVCAGKA